jgi:hypothetical protein
MPIPDMGNPCNECDQPGFLTAAFNHGYCGGSTCPFCNIDLFNESNDNMYCDKCRIIFNIGCEHGGVY